MKNDEDKIWKRPKKKKWNPFNNTVFTLCFSFLTAIVIWYTLSTQDTGVTAQTRDLYDVPIDLKYSEAAIDGGLHIYSQNELNADVTISASSTVRNRLTSDDVTVTGTFAPSSVKTSGTALMTATVKLEATKNNTLGDYEILEVTPSEITVEYDKPAEATFTIEKDQILPSAKTGYVVGTTALSASEVVVSGPESSVNQISKAAVKVEQTDLSEDTTVVEPLTLYGQDEKEINLETMPYLELSVTEVEVTIPVLAKKTVPLVASYYGKPDGFSESRISVTPSTIDIAASSDEIKDINEITLTEAIYFSDVTSENNSFTINIPLPNNIKNLYNTEKATVEFNLNGFKEVTKTTTNFQLINKPSDNVEMITQSLSVKIIGSESQVAKLTGESVYVTVDLSNRTAESGVVTVPVSEVYINGAGADTCWAVGVAEYEVSVNLSATSENVSSETE